LLLLDKGRSLTGANIALQLLQNGDNYVESRSFVVASLIPDSKTFPLNLSSRIISIARAVKSIIDLLVSRAILLLDAQRASGTTKANDAALQTGAGTAGATDGIEVRGEHRHCNNSDFVSFPVKDTVYN
jgi:hypothetical protein